MENLEKVKEFMSNKVIRIKHQPIPHQKNFTQETHHCLKWDSKLNSIICTKWREKGMKGSQINENMDSFLLSVLRQ